MASKKQPSRRAPGAGKRAPKSRRSSTSDAASAGLAPSPRGDEGPVAAGPRQSSSKAKQPSGRKRRPKAAPKKAAPKKAAPKKAAPEEPVAKQSAASKSAVGAGARRHGSKRAARGPKAIPSNPFLVLLSAVKKDVDTRLQGIFRERVERARSAGKPNQHLVAAARDLCLRGGKRLRAALVLTGYQLARGAPKGTAEGGVLELGAAVELLQSYFLIHDDWMDQDDVRRGGPTVHTVLTERFKSPLIGERSAILAGDFTVSLAQEVAAGAAVTPSRSQAVFRCFAQMQTDAVLGQQLDLLAHKQPELTYELKTGSYTVRGPLRLGALLAGARPQLLDTIDAFSLPVGVAFQLRDDLIGAFGDPAHTGKPLGSDLTAGKHTALLATALRKTRGPKRQTLQSVVGNVEATPEAVRQALDVLDTCGAKLAIESRIEELVEQAMGALGESRLPAPRRALLEGAARALTARSY